MKLITNLARLLTFISVISSCSSRRTADQAPPWVDGIRSGEQSLKVTIGNRVLFRRIAGQAFESSEKACEEAIGRVENDLKKEFPHFLNIPYSLEVLFYDPKYEDCAVTVSIDSRLAKLNGKERK